MSLLSVIIPVYNVERYLDSCVSSVLNQQYRHLEIIIVDDGSTDTSPALCDHYAALDSRVRVIHQPNAGVSAARNAGIASATGDYLTFVDSDDWISPHMYAEMMQAVNRDNKPDVVMCDYINERVESSEKITAQIRAGLYTKSEIVSELYPSLLVTDDLGRLPIISACVCLFKSILLKDKINFEEDLRYSEDYLFMAEVMVAAKSFCYLKEQYFYHYRQYDQSRSKKYQPDWWPTLVSLNIKLTDLLAQNEEYNFTYQLKLQMMHSAMFLTNAIYTNRSMTESEKVALMQKIFNDPTLENAFENFTFEKQSPALRITLNFFKYKQARAYFLYRNLIARIKNTKFRFRK